MARKIQEHAMKEARVKKLFLWLFFLLGGVAGWCGDNTSIPNDYVVPVPFMVDERFMVRFSTLIPQNVAVQLMSTQTAQSCSWAPGINYSTGGASFGYVGTSSITTFGGRALFDLQCSSCVSPVYFEYNSVNLSSALPTQSQYLTQGQFLRSADLGIGWQGPLYVISPTSAVLTGHLYFDRIR